MNTSPSSSPGKRFVIVALMSGVALVFVSIAMVSFFAVRSFKSGSEEGSGFKFSAGKLFNRGAGENVEYFPDSGNLAIVDVRGVIFKSRPLLKRFDELGKREDVKAIVIRIDSPGGAVGPSQEIHDAVVELKTKHSKKVICSLGDIAASGGYYIAAACEKIVANPGSLTGSIGVIMQLVNLQGLYNWAKVEPQVLKAGKYKDMGSETRPMKDEEKKLFQDLLDGVHTQFRKTVQADRGLSNEQIEKYADGRIFTGEQGKEYGFVDQLGGEKQAIELAAQLAGIEGEPEIIRESIHRNPWGSIFGGPSFPWDSSEGSEPGEGAEESAQVSAGTLKSAIGAAGIKTLGSFLPGGASLHLKPGVPYFLPSFFLSEGIWRK